MTQNRVPQQSCGRTNSEKADSCSMWKSVGVQGYVLNTTCASLWSIAKTNSQTLRQRKFPAIVNLNQVSDRWNAQTKYLQATREHWNKRRDKKRTRTVREDIMNSSYFELACLKEGIHSTFLISHTPILKTFHHLTVDLISVLTAKSKAPKHKPMHHDVFEVF